MHTTTAVFIQECAEEAIKEVIKLHDETCDVVVVCVPMGKGAPTLKLIQELLGFTTD